MCVRVSVCYYLHRFTQSATGHFDSHRCELGSNDDFLIGNDHWSPEMPIIPLEVGEVGNVDK